MIRALIVDDENHARSGIRALLALESDFQVVGECSDGREALEMIETLRPDALFIDVQMPCLTGLEVLQKSTSSKRPYTVIVSAYDSYALPAFDAYAMDYLLKPVDSNRFKSALIRLRSHIDLELRADGKADLDELLRRLQQPVRSSEVAASDRVPVKIGRRIRFLSLEHIRYLIANGSYVNLYMSTGEVIHTSERISQMEGKLISHHFIRIHRSVILNIDQIREVHSTGTRYEFAMAGGENMTSGVTYKMNIQNLLAAWKKTGDIRTG
ncbi:MAG TPA: response regulator [Gammaproteobacteria bacterium]|jgi:two-component system LytT family response regulator|nr:response regulator [Gammaproteobacteria bacterium]